MGVMDRLRICLKGQPAADDSSRSTADNHEAKQLPGEELPLDGAKNGGGEISAQEGQGGTNGRVQWTSPTEFLLTCIGFSVGLGNVWRFPYLCYKNGGGAFLIPYTIMIVCIGIPLLFMEYSSGQYFGIGSLSIFKTVSPMFKGIGICYCVLNSLVCIYYNVIIAISLYYMFSSFTSVLPWSHCNHTYNTINCGEPTDNSTVFGDKDNTTGLSVTVQTIFESLTTANTTSESGPVSKLTSPSEEFFKYGLLGEGDDQTIDNIGAVRWKLCLCLLLAWILVAIFVSKGIKSSGKVSYLTTTFPYIMLTVLVVRGVTLDGALDGILYFIVPQWEKLLDADVWFQASVQMFYALNLAWGGMITMSSYNQMNHNCRRDAIVINLVSFGTSLYAGVAVFSIIGFMAKEQGMNITQVIESGPGLAFIAYPRALSKMPLAPFFSIAFFFMLFLLGIGSQMVCVETIITGIMDTWHFLVRKWQYRVATIGVVSSVLFLLGIPCTTQGGMYVLQLMDHYAAGFSVLIIAVFECLIFNWIYGHEKMKKHIKEMLNYDLAMYWSICWKFVSPILILIITIMSFVKYKPVEYGNKEFPPWTEFVGWCMALASILPIFIVAVFVFVKTKGNTVLEKFKKATAPVTDDLQAVGMQTYGETKEIGLDEMEEVKVLMTSENKEPSKVSFGPVNRKGNGNISPDSMGLKFDRTVDL